MSSIHSQGYQAFLVRLRRARSEARLTQLEVAQQLGVYNSFVSKCESGERRVDIAELVEFAKIYGKPLSFFYKSVKPRRRGGKRRN